MHDGSSVRLRSTAADYDPTDRTSAYAHVRACQARGEIATGLLFVDEDSRDMHDLLKTPETPLIDLPYERLCPGAAALDALMARYR
jgi:2-oxoglutarate ferredoxin oxidoreductase subunit beta